MLKNTIKGLIFRAAAERDEKAILEKLKDKAVVSFDVFDTAVKRDVRSPADVFALMEEKLKEDKRFSVEAFSRLRVEAEQAAHKMYPERDVTLAEIYGQMPSLTEDQREGLMRLECETELAVAAPNPPIKRVYDACMRQGKKALFISDMYLPAKVVAELLRKNGYDPTSLYVSCEAGQRKKDGGLFSHVRQAERLAPAQWCHIGDSISADYLSPKRLGIEAILIERDPRRNEYVHQGLYRKNASYRQLNHFIDARLSRYADPYEQIGYAVLGPLLYGFSRWLDETIPKEETIVFLAREGALLQRAFEIVSKRPSVFLYISRRAAHMAYLATAKDIADAAQSKFHTIINKPTYQEMIEAYGFSEEEIAEILRRENLDATGIIKNSEMELELLQKLWPQIKERAGKQYGLLQEYLEQLGANERCSVVDVGWQGTIQAILTESKYRAKGRPIQWKGYYYGIKAVKNFTIERRGFLFEENNNQWMNEGILNSAPFFEMLFLATGGTTKGYRRADSGRIEPLLGDSDNDEGWNRRIQSIQETGLRFVEDMSRSPARKLIAFDAAAAAGNYQAIARVPSRKTLQLFHEVKHGDGRSYNLGYNLGYYILHPRKFLFDFETKRGRVWFLKDLLKIPLPYMAMVNLARKLFGK